MSCTDRAPRRISVELDGRSLGTQSIPCIEGFVAPLPTTTFTASASIGAHVLTVIDLGARREGRRAIELVAPESGASVDAGVFVNVQVSDREILIDEPTRSMLGTM